MTNIRVYGVLAILTGALVACGSDSSSGANQDISDGDVTFEQYQTSFLGFQDCMEREGSPLVRVDLVSETKLFTYEVPQVAVENGTEEECYPEFGRFDSAWQLSDERPRPAYENMTGVEIMLECLADAGVEGEYGSLSGQDLIELLENRGLSVNDCFSSAQQRNP